MSHRRILTLAGLAVGLGLAFSSATQDARAFDWRCCLPRTTTIHGCYGYRVASHCSYGQVRYQSYDVGAPNVLYDNGPPYSNTSAEERRRYGYFSGWREAMSFRD